MYLCPLGGLLDLTKKCRQLKWGLSQAKRVDSPHFNIPHFSRRHFLAAIAAGVSLPLIGKVLSGHAGIVQKKVLRPPGALNEPDFISKCISCGACAAINPECWEMDEQGLAHLKGSAKVDDHYELEIDEKDKDSNQEAAEVCPVNIINVKKIDKN